jgi:penicillin-binding protein 1A
MRWLRRILVACLVLVVLAVPVGLLLNRELDRITADLPTDLSALATWRLPTACTLLDDQGRVLDTFYVERRYPARHDELPDHVWQAFVASEDAAFFEHAGVDALGILRALVVNARAGHTVQGGSTLTQQVVKNTLLTSERSLERKIREAVLALRLEQELSKQQILTLYLDLVYLGSNNYGIEAASLDYFGVSAHELTVAQAALLAGLVPAPSRMSPRVDPEEALRRRSLVLRRMLDVGYLDAATMVLADESPLVLARRPVGASVRPEAGYLTAARREIRRVFGPDAAAEGLEVTVPLNLQVQAAAEKAAHDAVQAHVDRNGPRLVRRRGVEAPPADPSPGQGCFPALVDRSRRTLATATRTWTPPAAFWRAPAHDDRLGQRRPLGEIARAGDLVQVCEGLDGLVPAVEPWAESAVVVIDNDTAEVIALAGSHPLAIEGFVPALQARRQPGSSFKPYVYGAALQSGLTMLSDVVDGPISLPAGGGRYWTPKNYGGGYAGNIRLTTALAISANTVAVRLIRRTGPDAVITLAHDLGVATPIREGDLTIALGTSEVTPIDQATAYSSIARLGVHRRPTWIRQAVSVRGGKTEDRTPVRPETRVLPAGTAYELVQMMGEVVRRGSGRAADIDGVTVAGKTGTTNDNVDAWFVGFTPDHTIAVWVGTDSNRSLGARETGGRAAAPAFAAVARSLPLGASDWAVPDDVVRIIDQGRVVGLRRAYVPEHLLPARVPQGPLPTLE